MYLTRLQSACVKILMRKSFMILPRLAYPSDRVLRDTIKKSPANEGWSLEDYRAFWGGGGSSKFVVTKPFL